MACNNIPQLGPLPLREQLANMNSSVILPPEVWCIVYEWAIRSSIDDHEHCTHINFPDAILHFRSPQTNPSISRLWLRDLRLVCRASKALLDSTPQLIVSTNEKVVYIEPVDDLRAKISLIMSERMRCRSIVVLNLPASESNNFTAPMLFDFLCENARSLPALRSLTIGLTVKHWRVPETPRFWGRLNEAFPDLECLVARGQLNTTWETSMVTFKKLKVIDMDFLYADIRVQLPAVRHAAFGAMNYFKAANFTGCRNLESLLLRSIADPELFNWDFVPNLRLLGLPRGDVRSLPPLPQEHPLDHLYLYVDTVSRTEDSNRHRREEELKWLVLIVGRFPTISRITMAFEPMKSDTKDAIWGDFDDDEMQRLGFTADYIFGRGGRRIVIERIQDGGATPVKVERDVGSQGYSQLETVARKATPESRLKGLRRLSAFRVGV